MPALMVGKWNRGRQIRKLNFRRQRGSARTPQFLSDDLFAKLSHVHKTESGPIRQSIFRLVRCALLMARSRAGNWSSEGSIRGGLASQHRRQGRSYRGLAKGFRPARVFGQGGQIQISLSRKDQGDATKNRSLSPPSCAVTQGSPRTRSDRTRYPPGRSAFGKRNGRLTQEHPARACLRYSPH